MNASLLRSAANLKGLKQNICSLSRENEVGGRPFTRVVNTIEVSERSAVHWQLIGFDGVSLYGDMYQAKFPIGEDQGVKHAKNGHDSFL